MGGGGGEAQSDSTDGLVLLIRLSICSRTCPFMVC